MYQTGLVGILALDWGLSKNMDRIKPIWTTIIVTHNSRADIGNCLTSLEPDAAAGLTRVVVVDNASTDGGADLIRVQFPWIYQIKSPDNGGFGAGNNLGFRLAEGDYCFIINPDTEISHGCGSGLVEFLETHPDAGCVGPGIRGDSEEPVLSYFAFTSLTLSLWIAVGFQRLTTLNRTDGRLELRRHPPANDILVDRLLGAAMMVRRKAFEQVGGFDETFFLYSEEEDLCFRMSKAGWKVYYHPESWVHHHGAGSTSAMNAVAVAATNWSRYLYLRKHSSRLKAEISRWVWVVMLFLRLLISWLRHPFNRRTRSRGYVESLKSLLFLGYFERVLRPPRVKAESISISSENPHC